MEHSSFPLTTEIEKDLTRTTVFLRSGDTAVGLRYIIAMDTSEKGTLRIAVNHKIEKRLRIDGRDTTVSPGILSVNGRELGAEILR